MHSKLYKISSLRFPESNTTTSINVSSWNFRIQEMRLISALIEAHWSVIVNRDQLESLIPTQNITDFHISERVFSDKIDKPIEPDIIIDHSLPWTQIFNLGQPLFFPTWLARMSREKRDNRDIRISFNGCIYKNRLSKILDLIYIYKNCKIHSLSSILYNFLAINYDFLTLQSILTYIKSVTKYTDIKIYNSQVGRQKAGKILDINYWKILRRSQFVFCPAGDFGWTYRFYESILAGACPIIEQDNQQYIKDFYFIKLGDPLPNVNDIDFYLEKNWETAYNMLCNLDELSKLRSKFVTKSIHRKT